MPYLAKSQVLLADESEWNRELLRRRLERVGLSVQTARDGEEAWALFQEHPFELVVTGLNMPALDSIGLTRRIRSAGSQNPRVPVLLITAFGTLSSAVAAGRAGVTDAFPLDDSGIEALVARARELIDVKKPRPPNALLGTSSAVVSARERIAAVAALSTPVLVSGERGSGHFETVAYLHALSPLSGSPLHRVDCAAARNFREPPGRGFCYLEEVHELSRDAQEFWRRWIRKSEAAGDSSGTRVIAATTKDLSLLSGQALFSPELAEEFCQFEIRLPPLRQRRDDLPKLIRGILEVIGERIGRPTLGISQNALELLCGHAWWGNLVELENVLESLAAFCSGAEITEAQTELVLIDSDPVMRAARERARLECEQLLSVAEECGGNISQMAERLKVDRGTIRYRLRKHGIVLRPGPRGA